MVMASVERLRCEYRENPLGVDTLQPQLTWIVKSSARGDHQTAWQVLVGSSEETLAKDRGDLWDSGRVANDHTTAVYAGKPLISRGRCFWKVRAWNAGGQAGPWSKPAHWSMGLLHPSDWKAKWITSPILADPANRPRTPVRCYRSELSSDPNAPKWIALDLGAPHRINAVDLMPARPAGMSWDISTVQFPRRFRIEASDMADFHNARILVDQTRSDFPQPRGNNCRFDFEAVTVRYVRVSVTRLGMWDAHDYGIFLGQFAVFSGNDNVAAGAHVTASDSIETEQWSKRYLVTRHADVGFSPFPAALDPHMPGAFSPSRTPMLRRDFSLDAPVARATLYSTARGFYEARINGHKVGDDLLAPGFTDYARRISYQTHDVTFLLHKGPNAIGALLGYGWYAGHMNLNDNIYIFGFFPQLFAQLEIDLADGRHVTIATDGDWRTTLDGAVRWSDILDGEASDFRKELPGWDRPGFRADGWQTAWTQARGPEALVWQRTPPVKEIRDITPLSRKEVRPGVWVYDMGQEITGWVRLKVDGPAGAQITVRHSEMSKAGGELDTGNLWGAPQRDDYILDGKGPRVLEPHFTYHGFRYVEISGLPGKPQQNTITVVNIHTENRETGQFACSNDLFNREMNASRWTQKNLMFDVPNGCAGRSERLAWNGDIRPCVQTVMFNFDAATFFEKYAADIQDDQKADGRFTDISPHAHLAGTEICVGSPGWADAGVSLPWDVYVNTGNRKILENHYEDARRWVDYIYQHNPDFIWVNARGMDWGDWLSAGRATPKEIGSTAFFAHSADQVARMAAVLGHKEEAAHYRALFQSIRHAFAAKYVTSEGVIAEPRAAGERDVTDLLRGMRTDHGLTLTVNNGSMGGDPAPNVVKRLLLTVKIGGKEETREYPEDGHVDLNDTAGPLEIVRAVYGTSAVSDDAQGSYALALRFGLLDEPLRGKAVQRLIEAIKRDGGHPTTGFWSSIELLLALSDNGHNDIASQLMNLRTAPSWGHMVEAGTTFWESFDADKTGLSLNHWTHSACGEWLWRTVAGLNPDPERPGYAGFTIQPRPTPEVSWCKASYDSARGPIAIDWRVAARRFTLSLKVPTNSKATVYIPAASAGQVFESGQPIANVRGVHFLRMEDGAAVYEVQSGDYRFSAPHL